MDKKETMVLYVSHYEAIKTLPEKEQLITLKSIIEYSLYGTIPDLNGIPNLIFSMARPNIDASNKRRDASRANGVKGGPHGQKGGRPKKDETPTITPNETPNEPLDEPLPKPQTKPLAKPLNVNVNVKENVNVNVKANENGKEKKKLNVKKNDFGVLQTEAEQMPNPPAVEAGAAEGAEAKPQSKSFRLWTKADLAIAIQPFVQKHGRDLCNEFFAYWAEPTASGKIRVNLETAWDTSRRLSTWQRNNFSKHPQKPAETSQIPIPKFKTQAEAEQWVIDTHYRGRRELSALSMGISLTTPEGQPRQIEDIRQDVEKFMTSYQQ